MLSNEPRCIYENNQLADVICQLRFPQILAIQANLPVQFQEAIRDEFPQYASRQEMPAPKLQGTPGNLNVQKQDPVTNYQFSSADGSWRVNLTSGFISLACSRYTCWEDFARKLDKPLAAFIRIYKPAYFERVGLRYLNFISRYDLGLEGVPFSDLIQPCWLGPLSEEDMTEAMMTRCTVDVDVALRGGCKAKVHASPGVIRKNGKQDPEVKFIFDQDLYMPGNLPVNLSAGSLETLHRQADSIFRGAITPMLHNALSPREI